MLITVSRRSQPAQSADARYTAQSNATDYRVENEHWLLLIDSPWSSDRAADYERDAKLLMAALGDPAGIDSRLFEGIFGGHYVAFALNKFSGQLHVLRDVAGAKSAYVASSDHELLVGTCMHDVARRAGVRGLDRTAALHLMTLDYLFDGETFYQEVREFPIGSLSVAKGGESFELVKHYPLRLSDHENASSVRDNIQALRNGILEAHARRAGSENIVLLSGGVDSSVMLCALREVVGRSRVRAITFCVKNTEEDETGYAIALAKHLGVEIERIEVDPAEAQLFSNFEDDILQMNSPYFGRFIFGQFKGTPGQVFFAGQDTRLHTPDLNGLDLVAFKLLSLQKNPPFKRAMGGVANMEEPLARAGLSTSERRWQRGLFRALLTLDLDRYLPRFFFKLNPESLRADGYSSGMIDSAIQRVAVPWRDARNKRHLYNTIVEVKWGEQYTDDMRYLQDVARINQTNMALPFYDIALARLSSQLPFDQASQYMSGHSKFDSRRKTRVNKFLLREAFKNEMTQALYLRAKAVSRSQHLLFSGGLGRCVSEKLRSDLQRGEASITAQLGLQRLAQRFLSMRCFKPEDEVFLTKVYWLSVMTVLGRQHPIV